MQGRAPPEAEGVAQAARGTLGITRGEGLAPLLAQALEARGVELLVLHVDRVAGGLRDEAAVPDDLAEVRDQHLHHVPGGLRRRLPPQLVDGAIDGNGLAAIHEEKREQGPGPVTPEGERLAPAPHLQRAQEPELERPGDEIRGSGSLGRGSTRAH